MRIYGLSLDKRWLWRVMPIAALAACVVAASAGRAAAAHDEEGAGPPAVHDNRGPGDVDVPPGPPPGMPGREMDRPRGRRGSQDRPMHPDQGRRPEDQMDRDGPPPGPAGSGSRSAAGWTRGTQSRATAWAGRPHGAAAGNAGARDGSAARTLGPARPADASWSATRAERAVGLGRTAAWSAGRTARTATMAI